MQTLEAPGVEGRIHDRLGLGLGLLLAIQWLGLLIWTLRSPRKGCT